MKKFNHAFNFTFALETGDPGCHDLTGPQAREAILKSLASLDDDELLENLGAPFDSYEVSHDVNC